MSIYKRFNSRLSPEYLLLGFLFEHPSHGYVLYKRLIDEFGYIWHSSQSQSYNILKRLESHGYVTLSLLEQEKLPPRQLLKITETGAERFRSWLDRSTPCSVHAIRVEFITRLYFMRLYYPQNIPDMILAQGDVINLGLSHLRAELTSLPDSQISNRLALELRIELLNSVLLWLDRCNQIFGNKGSTVSKDD